MADLNPTPAQCAVIRTLLEAPPADLASAQNRLRQVLEAYAADQNSASPFAGWPAPAPVRLAVLQLATLCGGQPHQWGSSEFLRSTCLFLVDGPSFVTLAECFAVFPPGTYLKVPDSGEERTAAEWAAQCCPNDLEPKVGREFRVQPVAGSPMRRIYRGQYPVFLELPPLDPEMRFEGGALLM